ncbi:DUF3006 domain-containing protein (plasmid) [Deinococcus taeanensis]|uniref:DUF3006 domain-containing protein n=1 Tax=Deinococcus taeanensis TaxID=2737050 RepID=UPI001CDD22BF|nr:DUF3006 domain-containing protein [Deinococcus taeanensis]UBV45504.1 DUF3006 domain-containing protein [Deinococcus taeanensis]
MTDDSPPSTSPHTSTSVTVDGLEGEHARVELVDGTVEIWRLSDLPRDVQEGDILDVRMENGHRHVRIDRAETRRRTQHAQAELSDLNAGSPDGELEL